jgi:hypothetical protein
LNARSKKLGYNAFRRTFQQSADTPCFDAASRAGKGIDVPKLKFFLS